MLFQILFPFIDLKLVQAKFTVCISRNISKFGSIIEGDKKEKRVETLRDFVFHPQ